MAGSASIQAVTRVNVEQASKRAMREPTRLKYGEGRRCWGRESDRRTQRNRRGSDDGMYARGPSATREASRGGLCSQPNTREGAFGPREVAERPVVPKKPGNAGGGKGPQFKGSV